VVLGGVEVPFEGPGGGEVLVDCCAIETVLVLES